ncbi:hypothetical protein SNA_11030 [Streptomyces natalensis ATCC 27448]|uniref:Short-chain dehydrogenase n=1 Tax=Streptomyces natalensis ATCC 27448 TaxID=1240678 RepID=A0A0D7CPD6_9ACTN|nr:hypothetical protein SNA_11030 [Streptomyces natalensis ATCC 27448]
MARRSAADGLRVVLGDVEEEPLRAAADALRADGAEVLARTVDVGVREEVAAFADAAFVAFGAVHVLCEVAFTPVEQVADCVAEGIAAGRFWLLPASEHTDRQIRARAQSMLERADPAHLERFILDTDD